MWRFSQSFISYSEEAIDTTEFNTAAVIGGDSRQIYCAEKIRKRGYKTTLFGFDLSTDNAVIARTDDLAKAMSANIIVLPLPVSKNGKLLNAPFCSREIPLTEITELITPQKKIFYGMGTKQLERALADTGCEYRDYYKFESLIIKNALLTAEGVLGIITDKIPKTVFGMKIAITGYGRVGYFTAKLLKALGARVTVFARSPEQLAKAQCAGLETEELKYFTCEKRNVDCLINTVPAQIIKKDELNMISPDALLIETASSPYGIDFDEAKQKGFTVIKAFSIPGKTSPVTAGEVIADAVITDISGGAV